MRYRTVLLDLDHTLLDSDGSEAAAFAATARSVGLTPTEEVFDRYRTINRGLWAEVERGGVTPVEVRTRRFELFTADLGLADADPEAMADTFATGLGANGELYPGALAALEGLADVTTLGLVTNGLVEVQEARIERLGLGRFFRSVIISAGVGVAKPAPEIFDLVLDALEVTDRSSTVMVGDSLTSDIQGGHNAGIATCLYDPDGRAGDRAALQPRPTHVIGSLDALVPLVTGLT
ncbi:MAG: YjjG family noncanonical pyrimidine nucleotidase [Actinomycetota bacterium]